MAAGGSVQFSVAGEPPNGCLRAIRTANGLRQRLGDENCELRSEKHVLRSGPRLWVGNFLFCDSVRQFCGGAEEVADGEGEGDGSYGGLDKAEE